MSATTRTILLVEDEDSIALPLAAALEREGYATRITGSAPEAIALAAELQPDLMLLDVMLADGSGLDVCREVRRHSSVPIIMLTARGDETDRVVGLELGADDYVVKPFSARELVARIRAVLRRVPDDDPALRAAPAATEAAAPRRRPDRGHRDAPRRARRRRRSSLTRREFDLLALLVRNAGTVLTRERLIDEVWDTNWFGSTKTLDVHVSSLRRKLGDDAVDSRYLHTVRGVGFRFAAPGLARRMTYRRRLLAAFAYVLVLVIVALAVPLALSTRAPDRPRGARAGRRRRATGRGQRIGPARTAPGELDALAGKVARNLGARVIIVGPHGLAAGRLGAAGRRGTWPTAIGRRSPTALDGPHRAGPAALRDARRGAALHGRARRSGRPHGGRRARHPERGRDRSGDPPRPVRADRRRRARAARSGWSSPGSSRAR